MNKAAVSNFGDHGPVADRCDAVWGVLSGDRGFLRGGGKPREPGGLTDHPGGLDVCHLGADLPALLRLCRVPVAPLEALRSSSQGRGMAARAHLRGQRALEPDTATQATD